ncbi:MAG: RNA-directed DNA polymerase [Candidatus Latescibacter sp.]|nr:RNA-directed DNA polymerase [Candidatus Latescibacter sp.]
MRWESLVSIKNLKLAWRRINTGRNLQYKRFFRELYLVYESAADENLSDLHKKLIAKVWKPNHSVRIYLPKPSGLQRPISLLGIEDQILLQAIANVFARKLCKKRKRVENKTVFSNKLAQPGDSIFFTERWQITYRAFQEKCVEYFNKGYRWAAHLDLSAYYDTISHDLLIRIVSPRNPHPETWNIVSEWFQKWSAADSSAMTGHGIPQGPIASDFLAEAFFLPIDIELHKGGYTYLRYVDDIRLFGKTENEVLQIAIMLEQQCRHRGLIPQSQKFELRKLKSPQDAMGALPSIAPSDGKNAFEVEMYASEAQTILKSAIGGKPLKVKDKSRFRYVMYRAPADSKFLKTVLMLLPRHPEHIDAFIAYFANFDRRRSITNAILKYLESGLPYSYVRGELWHVITRIGERDELQKALPLARQDAKKRKCCLALSWGVMHFLIRCEAEKLSKLGRRLTAELAMSRALLAPIFLDNEFICGGQVIDLLNGTIEEQLAGARELQRRNISISSLGLRQQDVPLICRNSLHALGVIRRRRRIQTDWIAESLFTLYECANVPIWRLLLGSEYEHALQILIEAKARYPGSYSEWLALQDSFNDITIRQLFLFLRAKGLPGHSKLVNGKKMVKYGCLIAIGTPFDKQYPAEADQLREFHNRRNQLPGSHPYDERGGARNRWLKKKERDKLTGRIKNTLDQIVTIVDKYK